MTCIFKIYFTTAKLLYHFIIGKKPEVHNYNKIKKYQRDRNTPVEGVYFLIRLRHFAYKQQGRRKRVLHS